MKTTEYIRSKIERLPKGYIFTYSDFISDVNNRETVIKALNRMVTSGLIEKISKGKFYKPKNTVFGKLGPKNEELVKDLLYKDGKIIGYITGFSLFNKFGFTTQVSAVIQIGSNQTRPKFTRGAYRISYIKQKNTITKKNIPLLQILDSIKMIKKIPDATVDFICTRLKYILEEIPNSEIERMIKLALKYPPSVRTLLGALLEELDRNLPVESLFKSLNPISTYKYVVSEKTLSAKSKWKIK